MKPIKAQKTSAGDLKWLFDVTDSRQPSSEPGFIWVREGIVNSAPTISYPERHPFCELSISLKGEGTTFVGDEEGSRIPGDVLLLGPGIPHWWRGKSFPRRSIFVYFFPIVLIDIRSISDGVRLLRRFTAKQTLRDRLVRLPSKMREQFTMRFEEMLAEYNQQRLCRDMRLGSQLLALLVDLLRWEESQGINIGTEPIDVDWEPIFKALEYLREHHAQSVYAKDVAQAAGISESRLKILFRNALNLSWVKYLQGYRIHRAAALLGEGRFNVTEAALEVGFDSLSHFNETFHSFMGESPKHFVHGRVAENFSAANDLAQ